LIDEIKESEDQLTKMKGKQMTINKQKEELERELFEMKEEFKRLEAN
jgi:predicted  nucleic acid-binding Zn-ribbon protein